MKNGALMPVMLAAGLLVGCGGGPPDCSSKLVMTVYPDAGVADHAAKAPGNTVRYTAIITTMLNHPENKCAIPLIPASGLVDWSVSDPVHVTISSAKDATNGVATCVGATVGAVTVTGSTGSGTGVIMGTAGLTCQ